MTGGRSQAFEATAVGSSTWQVPLGVSSINILLVGGGGGGGGGYLYTNLTAGGGSGGGGGGGGVLFVKNVQVTPLQNISYTVGYGGTGGSPGVIDGWIGTSGTSGGTTSFGAYSIAGGGYGTRANDGDFSNKLGGGAGGNGGGTGAGTTTGTVSGSLSFIGDMYTIYGGGAGAGVLNAYDKTTNVAGNSYYKTKGHGGGSFGYGGAAGVSSGTAGEHGIFGGGGGGGAGGNCKNGSMWYIPNAGGNGGNGYILITWIG